jgi:hypothetical protein
VTFFEGTRRRSSSSGVPKIIVMTKVATSFFASKGKLNIFIFIFAKKTNRSISASTNFWANFASELEKLTKVPQAWRPFSMLKNI